MQVNTISWIDKFVDWSMKFGDCILVAVKTAVTSEETETISVIPVESMCGEDKITTTTPAIKLGKLGVYNTRLAIHCRICFMNEII